MGPWEIAVLAAAIAVVAGVIAKGIWNKKHKKGGCCGDSSHCGSCRRIRHPENSEK